MKTKRSLSLLLAAVLLLAIALPAMAAEEKAEGNQLFNPYVTKFYDYGSADKAIPSRDINMPVTIVTPKVVGKSYPLVVIAHGHGGSRQENGGFAAIAESLAANGIASIRMDFPGCGDSKESFAKNTLPNMMADIKSARDYMVKNYPVDADRVAILGYSMGGRLAMMTAGGDASYAAAGLLAPACSAGEDLVQGIGGDKSDEMYATAQKNGYVDYTTVYGQELRLSEEWFDALRASTPLEDFASFKGDVMLVYGGQDVVVNPVTSLAAVGAAANSARSLRTAKVDDADHGYGFYSDQVDVKQGVVDSFTSFFVSSLIVR